MRAPAESTFKNVVARACENLVLLRDEGGEVNPWKKARRFGQIVKQVSRALARRHAAQE